MPQSVVIKKNTRWQHKWTHTVTVFSQLLVEEMQRSANSQDYCISWSDVKEKKAQQMKYQPYNIRRLNHSQHLRFNLENFSVNKFHYCHKCNKRPIS